METLKSPKSATAHTHTHTHTKILQLPYTWLHYLTYWTTIALLMSYDSVQANLSLSLRYPAGASWVMWATKVLHMHDSILGIDKQLVNYDEITHQ